LALIRLYLRASDLISVLLGLFLVFNSVAEPIQLFTQKHINRTPSTDSGLKPEKAG
jgi:hypothetical protein